MNEVLLIHGTALLLAWPQALYLTLVYADRPTVLDRAFGPVEGLIYRAMGVRADLTLGWRAYGRALVRLHLLIGLMAFGILMFQGVLPLNPDGIPNLPWDLALHTVASFITNTN
jgi:potassium-transporting ATPase potassium-binding subunit